MNPIHPVVACLLLSLAAQSVAEQSADFDVSAAPDVAQERPAGQAIPPAPAGPYLGKRDEYLRRAHAARDAAIPRAQAHPERPLVHFTPPAQWMNDINGSYYDPSSGRYHLMYQHNPYADTWGHMHFGHATSTDLVNWRHEPIAVWPSYELGEKHCYSGGGIVRADGKPLVFYTSVGRQWREEWAVLSHDGGQTWEKHPETIKHIGEDGKRFSAQDAFIFRHEGKTFAISTSINGKDRKPGLWIYEALDESLLEWTFRGKFFEKSLPCPALARLDNKWALVWWDKTWVGGIDWENFKFLPEKQSPLIYSGGFNARGANLITTPDRTIFLTWITRKKDYDQPGRGWAGCCSLPTELYLTDDLRVGFRPVSELKGLRIRPSKRRSNRLSLTDSRQKLSASGEVLELNLELTPGEAKSCGVSVRQADDNPKSGVAITYSSEMRSLTITGTGEPATIIKGVHPEEDGKVRLHLFLDRAILELFVSDGDKYAVCYLHHPSENQTISAFASGGAAEIEATSWRLRTSSSQQAEKESHAEPPS